MIPTKGRIVLYHHPVDQTDWPAMILAVEQFEDSEVPVRCQIQVFRPGGNHVTRAVEGVQPGRWSWPPQVVETSAFSLDERTEIEA